MKEMILLFPGPRIHFVKTDPQTTFEKLKQAAVFGCCYLSDATFKLIDDLLGGAENTLLSINVDY